MAKERWKKCILCGIFIDADEKDCPRRGLNNPEHKLRIVKLENEEVKRLYKEKKLLTKHIASMERRFSQ